MEEQDSHLLHEDLRIVRHHVSIHHRAEGNVVTSWLDVLVHQLPEVLASQAVDQVSRLCVGAAHLAGQDLGVLERLVVDRPARDGSSTLGYGPVEQTYCTRTDGSQDTSLKTWQNTGALDFFALLQVGCSFEMLSE